MTDKMLSLDKLKVWADAEAYCELPDMGIGTYIEVRELFEAINSGQLDADCPKCGGSGRKPWLRNYRGEVEMTAPCDCPAATGGSEK